jgi:hypothetical protein
MINTRSFSGKKGQVLGRSQGMALGILLDCYFVRMGQNVMELECDGCKIKMRETALLQYDCCAEF